MDQHKNGHGRQGKTEMNNPTMNREYEQPETNKGNSGGQNNKQPTATQCETRWKNKREQPLQPNGKRRGKEECKYIKKQQTKKKKRKERTRRKE